MSSIYKITVTSDSLQFSICKHGMCTCDLMRPNNMVRAIIKSFEAIHSACNIPFILSELHVKTLQLTSECPTTIRNVESQLISNRRKLIPDFKDDKRLFDYFMQDHCLDAWNAHKSIVEINQILGNGNAEFFIADEEELNVVNEFDCSVFTAHVDVDELEVIEDYDISALEYYGCNGDDLIAADDTVTSRQQFPMDDESLDVVIPRRRGCRRSLMQTIIEK